MTFLLLLAVLCVIVGGEPKDNGLHWFWLAGSLLMFVVAVISAVALARSIA